VRRRSALDVERARVAMKIATSPLDELTMRFPISKPETYRSWPIRRAGLRAAAGAVCVDASTGILALCALIGASNAALSTTHTAIRPPWHSPPR
jgi:hypothetical protein